jgi:hypothetical protein
MKLPSKSEAHKIAIFQGFMPKPMVLRQFRPFLPPAGAIFELGKSISHVGKAFSLKGNAKYLEGNAFSREGNVKSLEGKVFSREGNAKYIEGKVFSREVKAISR